jgi:hypothetical protein
MKTFKKVKQIIARVLSILVISWACYLLVERLFVDPIKDVFKDTPVTFVNVMAIVIAYIGLFAMAWLIVVVLKWILKNI